MAAVISSISCQIGPGPSDDGGAGSGTYVGNWNLIGASCPTGPVTFPGLQETLNLATSSGILTISVPGCTITTSGTVTASGNDLRLAAGSMPASCSPDGCTGQYELSSGDNLTVACPVPQFGNDVLFSLSSNLLDTASSDGCTYHFQKQ